MVFSKEEATIESVYLFITRSVPKNVQNLEKTKRYFGITASVQTFDTMKATLLNSDNIFCSNGEGMGYMKKWILGIGCLLMAMTASAEEPVFRAFTAADGRVLEARIVDADTANGKVRIERKNGKRVWVAPEIFSEEDQVYIREWVVADVFMSESKFSISVEKQIAKKREARSDTGPTILTPVYFEILFHNRTAINFKQLKIDYQLHVDQNDGSRCVSGKIGGIALPAKAKESCRTKHEFLVTQFKMHREYNMESKELEGAVKVKVYSDEINGISFRLQGPMVDGVPVIREFSYPSDFFEKVAWYEPSAVEIRKKAQKLSYDALIEKAKDFHYGHDGETNAVKAIDFYQQALEADPAESAEIERKITNLRLKVCTQPQIALVEEWAEKNEDYTMYIQLALFYGSRAPSEFLNGVQAVKYALKAFALRDCEVEALAIAYARNGQFDLAVDVQREVIKRLKRAKSYSDALMDRYKFQYQLYKDKKAYTDGMENEAE